MKEWRNDNDILLDFHFWFFFIQSDMSRIGEVLKIRYKSKNFVQESFVFFFNT